MKQYWSYIIIFSLIFSFIIRIWGTGSPAYSDENVLLSRVIKMVNDNDLNPHWFSWPTLYFYFLLPIYNFLDLFSGGSTDITQFLIWSRFLTALIGTASVYLTYRFAFKIFENKVLAFFSLISMSVLFIHVVDSHYASIDVPMAFFTIISLIFMISIIKNGDLKWYLLSGFFIGLANSTKYNYPLLLMLPVAHILKLLWVSKVERECLLFSNKLLVGIIMIFIGLIIGSPYIILDFNTFMYGASGSFEPEGMVAMIKYLSGHRAIFASNLNGVSSIRWWIEYLFHSGLYYPMFVAFVGGFGVLLWKLYDYRTFKISRVKSGIKEPKIHQDVIFKDQTLDTNAFKAVIFVMVWFVVYFLTLSRMSVRFDRYILPITPVISIFIGVFLLYIIELLKTLKHRVIKYISLAVFLFFIIGISALRVLLFDYTIAGKDTRVQAVEWILENLDEDAPILTVGSGINIGQKLEQKGFGNIINGVPFDKSTVFSYTGELLILGSDLYVTAENYKDFSPYKEYFNNYQIIKNKGELVKVFSSPLFESGFFSPRYLEHSSTINTYHNPTIEIYRIPELEDLKQSSEAVIYYQNIDSNMTSVVSEGGNYLFNDGKKEHRFINMTYLPEGEWEIKYGFNNKKCMNPDSFVIIEVYTMDNKGLVNKNKYKCSEFDEIITFILGLKTADKIAFAFLTSPGIEFNISQFLITKSEK